MATDKSKRDKGKRPAKRPRGKKPVADIPQAIPEESRGAEQRVAALREKLKKSLENPEMRDQIVRAIRTMLNEEPS